MTIYNKSIALATVLACSMTANAQTMTLQEGKNEISASEAGQYDRVEYLRQAEAGQMILASFPAQLDGYYFGPDAERYTITDIKEDTDGRLSITTEEMADTEDFLPGVRYLITPTQNLESITCLTPAKKTNVAATSAPLVFQKADKGSVSTEATITVISKQSDGTVYDIYGRRQATPSKNGIYIMNNRKVVIK